MSNTYTKSFEVRIFPTKEQEQKLWDHVHSCRFMWNYMLDIQLQRYDAGEDHLSRNDMINQISGLRVAEGYEWLQSVSTYSLGLVCTDLSVAYKRLFSGVSRKPRFKSRKRSKTTFPTRPDSVYFIFVKMNTNQKSNSGNGNLFFTDEVSLAHSFCSL